MAAAIVQLQTGMIFARDFRVVRPLAEGGMGAVYVAEQLSTGNLRALKIMHPQVVADPKSRERFAQEARVGAQVRSAHVVEVAAAGVDEDTGTPWIAMELLDGEDLAAVVRRRGPLPPAEVREIFEQLGDALGRAHAAGIVHRDLKPENLFIAVARLRGVPFVVKVLDFGIAKVVAEHQTAATVTSALGSPLWMAPEQANRGAKVRPSTDVWALGLIAFYLLTGRSYWLGANAADEAFNLTSLLVEIMVNPLEPASARAASLAAGALVPAGFDGWFARCVVRDPDGRFPTGAEAVHALAPLLGDATAGQAATTPPSTPSAALPPTRDLPGGSTAAWNGTVAMGSGALATGTPAPASAPGRTGAPRVALAGVALLVVGASAAWTLRRPAERHVLVAAPSAPLVSVAPAAPSALLAPVAPTPVAPAPVAVAAVAPAPAPAETQPSRHRRHAPAARPAPAPSRFGTLFVICRPWCRATVDGSPRGTSPLSISLPVGSHQLICTRGADSRSHTVHVAEGQTARVVEDFTAQ